jgi:hypothetical protein
MSVKWGLNSSISIEIANNTPTPYQNIMRTIEIQTLLTEKFGTAFTVLADDSYQIETTDFRILLIFADGESWLRVLIPIVPAAEAATFWEELLSANFDRTLDCRYALHQDVLWGTFQHSVASLTSEDLLMAIDSLIQMKKLGVSPVFSEFVTKRVREIVVIAKQRGDSLEQTIQTLDRFYAEGVMGDLGSTESVRQEIMSAWRTQLTTLWAEIQP